MKDSASFEDLLNLVKGLSERRQAADTLVLTSLMDQMLQIIIEGKMPNIHKKGMKNRLFSGPNAPLGGFYSKIETSYALGIISDQDKDALNAMRHIRNAFAHSVLYLDFDSSEIDKLCKGKIRGKEGLPPVSKTPVDNYDHFTTVFDETWHRLAKINKAGALAKALARRGLGTSTNVSSSAKPHLKQ